MCKKLKPFALRYVLQLKGNRLFADNLLCKLKGAIE